MPQKPLNALIAEYRTKYDSIGPVWSKTLNSRVYFTSEGKNHLIYKKNRKKRTEKEQRYKLNLFPLVIPVLKHATEVQSWRFAGEASESDVQHYALVARVGKHSPVKVRVIVKRTGDGQFNFHSVMEHEN